MRKVLSILLTLALCIGLMPVVAVPVSAVETGEISYSLKDTYGDGWNGAAIRIVDKENNSEVTRITIESGGEKTGTVELTVGNTYQFIWVSGSYDGECSYTFMFGNAIIFEGSGSPSSELIKEYVMGSIPSTDINLWIADTRVTSENLSGTGWSFAPDTNTLTLNNFSCSAEGHSEANTDTTEYGTIFSKIPSLTIELIGRNTVTHPGGTKTSQAIFSTGGLTFTGSGSLTATAGEATDGWAGHSIGIQSYVSVTLDSTFTGIITSNAGYSCNYNGYIASVGVGGGNKLTVNNGALVTSGGTVTVTGYGRSYGVYANGYEQSGGTVISTGGTVANGSNNYSYGMYAGNSVSITGGGFTFIGDDYAIQNVLTLGSGVDALASTNKDGTGAVAYSSGSISNYRYISNGAVAPALPSSYDVTVSAGAGMTLTSGSESQTGLSGAMTDVVYTANEGYYFPDPYSSAGTKTGVTVTRDSYTQITVSGTPTADTTIDLAAATAKTKLSTPAATFALDGDSNLVISGLVDGTTYCVGFPDGGAADFDASGSQLKPLSGIIAGNYSIKALATGNAANEHIDSDAAQVTITKAAAPTGVGKTDCTTAANNDGTITGVDNTMEYQKSGDTAWTAVTGTSVTGLVPGTYSVRIATAGTALASDPFSVTIAEYNAPLKVETPTFDPADGTPIEDSLEVTISCVTTGAAIHYTLDGSDPTENSAVTTGAAITLNDTTIIKAIAILVGYENSDIATAKYTKSSPSTAGGGGTTTYPVKPLSTENGNITVSPRDAAENMTVTITVTPDEGYVLDQLTVKDKDGNEIKVTEKDGKYTFTMPASSIEIAATFNPAEETPATDGFPFVDVPETLYCRKAVEWALENGVTGGTSPTTFSPKAQATRGQTMTFLWAAAGAPEPKTTENPFKDISEDDYYYKAILWAYENGITAGISADEFGPEVTVTRAQVATFLYGIAGRPDAGSEPFTDVSEGDYFEAPVAWAYKEGITTGTSETTFSPDADCLREQIITFMYLYFGAE